jgi:hypothetical protein
MKLLTLRAIGRGVLVFWALWLSVVALTNVLDALQAASWLPTSWTLVSGNWLWITKTLEPLGVGVPVQVVLFAGAIVWEVLAAVLFWRASAAYAGRKLAREPEAVAACAVNLALWSAFQVLDEVFLAYQPEGVHRAIFANQVLTILLLWGSAAAADETASTT